MSTDKENTSKFGESLMSNNTEHCNLGYDDCQPSDLDLEGLCGELSYPVLSITNSMDENYEEFLEKYFVRYDTFDDKYYIGNDSYSFVKLFKFARKTIRENIRNTGKLVPNVPTMALPSSSAIDSSRAIFKDALEAHIEDNLTNSLTMRFERLEAKDNGMLDKLIELWPGIPEISKVLIKKWLVSLPARALDPGCKQEGMLMIHGPGGIGKSDSINYLNEAIGLPELDQRDTFSAGRNALLTYIRSAIVLFDDVEFSKVYKSRTNVKGFLSKRVDKFTLKHSNETQEIPRSFICAATTNNLADLPSDKALQRRVWPVLCDKMPPEDFIKENALAILENAKFYYETGFSITLSKPEREQLLAYYDSLVSLPDDEMLAIAILQNNFENLLHIRSNDLYDQLITVFPEHTPAERAELRDKAFNVLGVANPKTVRSRKLNARVYHLSDDFNRVEIPLSILKNPLLSLVEFAYQDYPEISQRNPQKSGS